jgi:hypothetical protein
MNHLFPEDSAERKEYPVFSGFVQYFPSAMAAVAHHSFLGNQKHNPGQPLNWDRAKSGDEQDAELRHLMEADYVGNAWRAMAILQKHLEVNGAPIAPAARNVDGSAARKLYDEAGAIAAAQDAAQDIDRNACFTTCDQACDDCIPAESAYLGSFSPNDDIHGRRTLYNMRCPINFSENAGSRIATPADIDNLRNVLTAEELKGFGIGDVPRHPMHAEALRDHDERLSGPEDRL